ncbi:PREDICTED: lipoxygenase 2, chloroplastic isoform X1 [Camelina sativa]|uniref:Lipoxygenase n=1 Tax=Camelina sativa TaxID=90675 RepID=A0ABM0ZF28_CAMSA|nr:PREDICTED: lipoxygenase 2, chloroplastic isoform X2 [Camelina sativa]XP_010514857.1 PREDICTED: lipoxygenase 2, chloroplastic isoform X1 [Camelina sativa]
MFCRESSSSLQTVNIAKSLSSLFPKPSALINPIFVGRRDKLPRGGRCKVTASRANTEHGGNVVRKNAPKIKVKGFITAQEESRGIPFSRPLDQIADIRGKSLLVELISAETDPRTGTEKDPVEDYAQRIWCEAPDEKYECEFEMPEDFGTIGAIRVQNQYHRELFLKKMEIKLPDGSVTFTCDSWIAPKSEDPAMRIFFSSNSYLPSQTPEPLKQFRKKELDTLKGNNREKLGEFTKYERVYDYDVYNDLGDPDNDPELARPVIGGLSHPYPRRCKTGRKPCESDPSSEQRYGGEFYVPRDEEFSTAKGTSFTGKTILAAIPAVFPQIESVLLDPHLPFPHFKAIQNLFEEGIELPKDAGLLPLLPRLIKAATEARDDILQFEAPVLINRDGFSWLRDHEFARQTLAGLNPYCIELVKEWPLKSKLDPAIYGDPTSLITWDIVEKEVKGNMSVDEALKSKRLFVLDYHDLLLPYVNKVRELDNTTLYASRTLFFLSDDSTLRPVAIELTCPPNINKPQWKQVFTPGYDATSCWLWSLAKTHAICHDAGYHQLISHWLRTHCCMEPYIIAANRQLSAMHPIYRLLHPHFRYTMEINARARQSLINGGGIIETCFWPGKYSVELSSDVYDKLWRFDMEGLPADLIRRGLAEEDETAKHGLRLTIPDYPFANDGLILWDAIKEWVTDYVKHYYPDAELIKLDEELQGWWSEVRNVGHGDKKDEPWWPVLETQDDLIGVLTTIAWVASGHHAAVNFGQYGYGGYFPNRPTTTRIRMPVEEPTDEELKEFFETPEKVMLKTYPSQKQATLVMVTLDLLSTHSPDEEYIGEYPEASWANDPIIFAAYERFKGRLQYLEGVIDERNVTLSLKNRAGAGVVKYELLKPISEAGVTGMGVPYSISI